MTVVGREVKGVGGVVLAPDGIPVFGVKIEEVDSAPKRVLRATVTDASGHFSLENVTGQKLYHLNIVPPAEMNEMIVPVEVRISFESTARDQTALFLKTHPA